MSDFKLGVRPGFTCVLGMSFATPMASEELCKHQQMNDFCHLGSYVAALDSCIDCSPGTETTKVDFSCGIC